MLRKREAKKHITCEATHMRTFEKNYKRTGNIIYVYFLFQMEIWIKGILIMAIINGGYSMEFQEMNNQSGLFFKEIAKTKVSFDSFVLVYHINLTEYYNIQEKTTTCYTSIQKVCKSQGNYCEMVLIDMERKMSRMNEFETNIQLYEPIKHRAKRNPIIAAAALIASIAFGVIDIMAINKYDKMISDLRADYTLLHKIQTDETIFLKENIIANKNTFKFLANITDEMTIEFEKKINNLYEELTWANREMIILKIRDIFEIWTDEHEH